MAYVFLCCSMLTRLYVILLKGSWNSLTQADVPELVVVDFGFASPV